MANLLNSVFSLRRSKSSEVKGARRGIGGAAGVVVTEDSAMRVSAFYRGVIYISSQIAKLPWDLKDKNNKVIEDNLSKLLNLSPNPEMNAMTFRLLAVQTAIIAGNFYAEIERNGIGTPVALWPLNSWNVEPVRDSEGTLFYRVSGNNSDRITYLSPNDVFHIKNLHTLDGIVGQGVVSYAINTLGIAASADRMAGNLFANSGIPSGVISHPGKLSDAAYERLKQSWREQHGGSKTGGTAILEEGSKFEGINVDPQVLQFLESRKFSVGEIARYLGLTPTKLGDMTTATFSNVENANLEVVVDTLDAWACNFEMEADTKILTNRFAGKYTELDLYAVFRGDMASRGTYYKDQMAVGAMTPNEIRAREGRAPYADGDEFYIATNNFTPASRVKEVIDAQIASKKNSGKDNNTDTKKTDEDEKALKKEALRILQGK